LKDPLDVADKDSSQGAPSRSVRPWLSRNIVLLGLVSLLTDTASEMMIPLLPIFLTGVLGAGPLALGWIEGAADAAASALKLVSGRWADRMGRHRPLIAGGYLLSSSARPLIALAGAAWHVLALRLVDRVGKGLRTSPRDALIAASVPPAHRGAAFGLHRSMDHAGAVIGPLIAAVLLALWTENLRLVFALTAVPGAAAVLIILLGVREAQASESRSPHDPLEHSRPTHGLWRLFLPLGLFTLGNASDVFLLLKAGAAGAPLVTLPLLWMGLHVVKTVASIPGGILADRWGRRKTVALGWLVYAAVYTALAFAESQAAIWALFIAYGAYHGLTEGPVRALIAEIVAPHRRGTGFGTYHLLLGGLTLAANVFFGALWNVFGSRAAFLASAALALLAVPCLWLLNRRTALEPPGR
jgi:MFS family permease